MHSNKSHEVRRSIGAGLGGERLGREEGARVGEEEGVMVWGPWVAEEEALTAAARAGREEGEVTDSGSLSLLCQGEP